MNTYRKTLAACAVAVVAAAGLGMTSAAAAPPGPGDKQCIPGLNGPPQPGKKGGTCPGR